jgi:hypothetical protein
MIAESARTCAFRSGRSRISVMCGDRWQRPGRTHPRTREARAWPLLPWCMVRRRTNPIGSQPLHIFIDESGTFIPTTAWAVVCSLAIPHKEVVPARRQINRLSRDWPRKGGELKGGMLKPTHLESLVEVFFGHDALMHACAIDMSRENAARVGHHKAGQCEGMTKHLTPEHHPDLVRAIWELRHVLERMSPQLYIQCVMMKELVRIASEQITLYFAQRRPRELAKFEWTIDAKDPRRITSQERWWRDVLAVWLESASRREPFIFVKDTGFDYKYFNRSFGMTKEMWFPNRPPETMEGHDLRKMMSERMAFVDSRSEILIQAVDILTSFLRRLLAKQINSGDVAQALGRLQISKQPQSLRLVTLSREARSQSELGNALQMMTRAARTMFKPDRTRRRPAVPIARDRDK